MYLLVFELDQIFVVLHNLVPLAHTLLEQFRQRKPLPRHLVPIVRIHKLVVVHTIRRVSLHPLHRRLAAVQRDHIVDQRLARFVQGERLGRVRRVVFGRGGLPRFEVFAGGGGVAGEVCGAGVGGGGGHGWAGGGGEGAGVGFERGFGGRIEGGVGYEGFG